MGVFNKIGRPFKDELTNLEKIVQIFIQPLLRYNPEQSLEQVFLEQVIFHTPYRDTLKYQAIKAFKIPGLLIQVPNVKVPGAGFRYVKDRAIVLVRHDSREPNSYQVSFAGGKRRKELTYELTKKEWESISSNLRALE